MNVRSLHVSKRTSPNGRKRGFAQNRVGDNVATKLGVSEGDERGGMG